MTANRTVRWIAATGAQSLAAASLTFITAVFALDKVERILRQKKIWKQY